MQKRMVIYSALLLGLVSLVISYYSFGGWDSFWYSMRTEIIGMFFEIAFLTVVWETLRRAEQMQKEKEMVKRFLSNYIVDLVKIISNSYCSSFSHDSIREPGMAEIKGVIDGLDEFLENENFGSFIRVNVNDEYNHKDVIYVEGIEGFNAVRLWVRYEPFLTQVKPMLVDFFKQFSPLFPERLKDIVLPLNNAIYHLEKFTNSISGYLEKDDQTNNAVLCEEKRQELKQLLAYIGEHIIQLMKYRDQILEEKKPGGFPSKLMSTLPFKSRKGDFSS